MSYLYPASRVYVFARNESERAFARTLGAAWGGDTNDRAPELQAAIIDTTPAWRPDVRRHLELAVEIPLRPTVPVFPLEDANTALALLKRGPVRGVIVLAIA